jgi:hypothetical protein
VGGKKRGTLSRSEKEGLPFCVRTKESGKKKEDVSKNFNRYGLSRLLKVESKRIKEGGR